MTAIKKIIILIILIAILGGIYFYSKNKTPKVPKGPIISDIVEIIGTSTPSSFSTTTPASYISLIDSSTHVAHLKFNISVDPKTVTATNIKPCIAETDAKGGNIHSLPATEQICGFL